jgi:hypothetical protein
MERKRMKPLIYLASPHSNPEPMVRQMRYDLVLGVLGILIKNGLHVFSPIVHSHNLNMEINFDFWKELDFQIISKCDELWVLFIDGTHESKGVKEEIKEAVRLGIVIKGVWLNGVGKVGVSEDYRNLDAEILKIYA